MAKVLRANEMSKCIGCFSCMLICAGVNRKDHSIQKSCIRIRTSGGLSGKFICIVCQTCREPACAEECPTGALRLRKGGGVLLSVDKCIGCQRCKNACVAHAVGFDNDLRKPIICHHCGQCAKYCPHGCLSMEEIPD